jgi:hypothetical protein
MTITQAIKSVKNSSQVYGYVAFTLNCGEYIKMQKTDMLRILKDSVDLDEEISCRVDGDEVYIG